MNRSLRIALVSETYLPQINGVSRTLERLTRFLGDRGDRVRLFIPHYRKAASPLPAGTEKREFASLPLPFYREVVLPFAFPSTLRRELADFRPNLVHVATEGPLGWTTLGAAQNLGLPLVSSYHSNFSQYLRLYGFGWLEGIAWRYLRRFHNATQRTFCPTPSIRTLLQGKGFKNVLTWGRGVDSRRFHPDKRDEYLRRSWGVGDGEIVLAYAGRLATEKNLEMLLESWRHFPREVAARLVLVGDGPLRSKLEKMADERVVFSGYQVGEDLARIYASADLFVFPSLSETFGNVLLEGMASGLPAVGFRVPGPQDVIRDGHTGCLVDTISGQALAEATARILSDPARFLEMRHHARRHAEEQSWETILGNLREQYLSVLDSPGAKG